MASTTRDVDGTKVAHYVVWNLRRPPKGEFAEHLGREDRDMD